MREMFSNVYVLSTGPRDGSWNMSFDRSLMQAFISGDFEKRFGRDAAVWRFYSWEPMALSLGYSQSDAVIDRERCHALGIDIVRRPTGGRAVLHADEITYSFHAPLCVSHHEIYRMVHEVLQAALSMIGVDARFCRSAPSFRARYRKQESVSCFTASARYELQVAGRKVVGSAQRMAAGIVLQHGSLLLSSGHRMLSDLLLCNERDSAAVVRDELQSRTASVEEITGSRPSYETMFRLMRRALERNWGIDTIELSYEEIEALF